MIRLGLGIDALSPHLTGIGRYTWELCAGLAANAEISDLKYFRFDRWYSKADHFLSSSKPPPPRLPRFLRKPIARRGFKGRLYHGPNYFVPPHAEQAVITVHDLSVLRFPEMHPVARLKDFERNFSRSVAHAGQIITDSEFIKAEVEALLGIASQRVAAVPLGVSASFFAARDRQADSEVIARLGLGNRRYALCVATLEPRKGLNHALRAFLAARERNGDLPCDCLVIVGAEGWKNNDLHTLIEPAVWSGRVVLPGYVAEADLLALYAQASLFLYPSAYEGFGLPPLEAMAMGVPTVVAPRASIPEVVGEWSLFAEPEDTDAFAEAILRGISDQAWRDAASCGGKTHAAQFTWERCVSSTIDVYRKALDCC